MKDRFFTVGDATTMPADDKNENMPGKQPPTPPVPDAVLSELLEQARGRNAIQRKTALKALQQMGPAGLEPLLILLYAQTRQRRTVKTVLTTFAVLLLPISLLVMPAVLLSICFDTVLQTVLIGLVIWVLNWFAYIQRIRLPLTARQKDLTMIFTEINDVRAVGPLADVLSAQSFEDPLLQATLTRLLLQMRSSDATLLTRQDRANLCRELSRQGYTRDPEKIKFVIAILRALEQVGDVEALPYVAKLAQPHPPPAPEVQAAAMRCLEFLQMSGGAQNSRQTYLRASDRTAANPGELLRPAQDTGKTHSDELLRPEIITTETEPETERIEPERPEGTGKSDA